MLKLENLELEVLCVILELVDDTSPHTIRSVACVNRYFNDVTRIIVHRHKTVDLRGDVDEVTVRTIAAWTNNPIIVANIRTLTIRGRLTILPRDEGYPDEGFDVDGISWDPLVKLISVIGKLQQFTWSILWPLPCDVLDALEQFQRRSTLRIFNFVVASPYISEPDPVVSRLAKSSALTHIRRVGVYHDGLVDVHEIAFRSIVASAPKLEYAGIVRKGHFFPTGMPLMTEEEQAQSLFYTHQKPNESIRQLTLDGFEVSQRTLQNWSKLIDLGFVENIKLSSGGLTLDYFEHAASMLPNLKHVNLNLRSIRNRRDGPEKAALVAAVQNYINTCSPLRTLSIWSWSSVLILADILRRHGSTLQSLSLHERDSDDASQQRNTLSLDDIRLINCSCPILRHLTFDLTRTHAKLIWERDNDNRRFYDELARFKHLQSVQIYFDNGWSYLCMSTSAIYVPDQPGGYSYSDNTEDDDDDDDEVDNDEFKHLRPSREAYLVSYAKRVWGSIFSSSPTGIARRLDLKFGEYEGRIGHGADAIDWRLRRHLVVRPHERDDRVNEPVVTVHSLTNRQGLVQQ